MGVGVALGSVGKIKSWGVRKSDLDKSITPPPPVQQQEVEELVVVKGMV